MKNISYHLLYICISVLFFQCSGKENKEEETIRPVKFIQIGNDQAINSRSFPGTAKAGNEIELSFREAGIIKQINVKKGQQVKKGDLIASLDNIEANMNYESALVELKSAESAKNTAKDELARKKSLYEKGNTPLKEYQSAKNDYQKNLAQYEAALRNKEILRSKLNYGVIKAPASGIIANTIGKVNERVQTGHIFAILNAGEKKKIKLELPENIINLVTLGLKASITFPTIAEKTFDGEVIEVSPITSQDAATYPVELEILQPTSEIRPGMAASVTFVFNSERPTESIIVPMKAVGENEKGNFVFIIETEDNKVGIAKKQQIEIGEIYESGFVVKSGLQDGQLVATAGLQSLFDGQKVKLTTN